MRMMMEVFMQSLFESLAVTDVCSDSAVPPATTIVEEDVSQMTTTTAASLAPRQEYQVEKLPADGQELCKSGGYVIQADNAKSPTFPLSGSKQAISRQKLKLYLQTPPPPMLSQSKGSSAPLSARKSKPSASRWDSTSAISTVAQVLPSNQTDATGSVAAETAIIPTTAATSPPSRPTRKQSALEIDTTAYHVVPFATTTGPSTNATSTAITTTTNTASAATTTPNAAAPTRQESAETLTVFHVYSGNSNDNDDNDNNECIIIKQNHFPRSSLQPPFKPCRQSSIVDVPGDSSVATAAASDEKTTDVPYTSGNKPVFAKWYTIKSQQQSIPELQSERNGYQYNNNNGNYSDQETSLYQRQLGSKPRISFPDFVRSVHKCQQHKSLEQVLAIKKLHQQQKLKQQQQQKILDVQQQQQQQQQQQKKRHQTLQELSSKKNNAAIISAATADAPVKYPIRLPSEDDSNTFQSSSSWSFSISSALS